VSLYYLQKVLYQLNRDPSVRERYARDRQDVLREYALDDAELAALRDDDVGLLYVMGVNGQILMHYAAFIGLPWDAYLEAMRDGVRRHGPVRAGIYALARDVAR
jgi:hypothetical protein